MYLTYAIQNISAAHVEQRETNTITNEIGSKIYNI